MQTYARIENGAVMELLVSAVPSDEQFHPALVWVDVSDQPIAIGWRQTQGGFAPPIPAPAAPAAPSLAELQAHLVTLTAQMAALADR